MNEFITQFIDYLRFEKRYADNTILAYAEDLTQFRLFIQANFENVSMDKIKSIHIRSWMASLNELGITAKSIHRKLSALNTFFRYLQKIDVIKGLPTKNIKKPKVEKRLVHFVRADKMPKVLQEITPASDNQNIKELNKQLIIEMLYQTGMRRSELLTLTLANIDLYNHQIKVVGKGNKERLIPINNQLATLIKQYLPIRASLVNTGSNQLLILPTGKAVYPKYIHKVVHDTLKSSAYLKKNSPHVLRHTFATHLLNEGADLNAIKELLGHASLAATQIYTHNSIEKLKNVHKNAHPKS